jgi:phage FluMu protein Com
MVVVQTETHELRPWRCVGTRKNGDPCRQLLARAFVPSGSIVQIQCHRCGTLNTIDKTRETAVA